VDREARISDETIRAIATTVSGARFGIGIAMIVAPGLTTRLMGLPKKHDNASVRTVARLFGVRETAVGAHAIWATWASPRQPGVYLLNACVDGGDAVVMALAAASGKKGERRAAIGAMSTAIPVTALWLWLRRVSSS
jgi:hypothetical protein